MTHARAARPWLAMAVAGLGLVGCEPPSELSATGSPDAAAQDAAAAGDQDAPADGVDDNCRWMGYGIGAIGRGQCDVNHLTAHGAVACESLGAQPVAARTVRDGCLTGGDEVQVFCCGATAAPSRAAVGYDDVNRLVHALSPAGARRSRDQALLAAGQACDGEGQRLGDWSVLYDRDGATATHVQFGCDD